MQSFTWEDYKSIVELCSNEPQNLDNSSDAVHNILSQEQPQNCIIVKLEEIDDIDNVNEVSLHYKILTMNVDEMDSTSIENCECESLASDVHETLTVKEEEIDLGIKTEVETAIFDSELPVNDEILYSTMENSVQGNMDHTFSTFNIDIPQHVDNNGDKEGTMNLLTECNDESIKIVLEDLFHGPLNIKRIPDYNRYLVCTICNQLFASKNEMEKHIFEVGCSSFAKQERSSSDAKIISSYSETHLTVQINNDMYVPSTSSTIQDRSSIEVDLLETNIEIQVDFYSCATCDLSFTLKNRLAKHILTTHNTGNNVEYRSFDKLCVEENSLEQVTSISCYRNSTVCERSSRKHLKRREKIVGKEMCASCTACKMTFSQKKYLTNHLSDNHTTDTTFNCTHCKKQFYRKSSLGKHMKTHDYRKVLPCSISYGLFEKKNVLTKHLKIHEKKNFYGANRDPQFSKHEKRIINDYVVQCIFCRAQFTDKRGLSNHMRIHAYQKPSFPCSICFCTFPMENLLRSHVKIHKEVNCVFCVICSRSFSLQDYLTIHMSVDHKRENLHQCLICNRLFSEESGLKRHGKVHNYECLNNLSNDVKFSNYRKLELPCTVCHRTFSEKRYLTRHMKIHKKKNSYCKNRNPQFSENEKHITNDYVVQCMFCGAQFTDKRGLSNHMRIHNYQEPSFVCSICLYTFPVENLLRNHVKIHKEENCVFCVICSRSFSLQDYLTKHMSVDHRSENLYQCLICNRLFSEESTLRRHVNMHNYECLICNCLFTKKLNLNRHMKFHKRRNILLVNSYSPSKIAGHKIF